MKKDMTSYGELLRIASKQNLHTVDDWKPIINEQRNNAHKFWSFFHGGRQWAEDKANIMNGLIKLNSYQKYLEIGGQPFNGERSTYYKVDCKFKDSIDPQPLKSNQPMPENCQHFSMTSDDFFKNHGGEKKYDIIFIDGFHEHQQVYRDIKNSLDCLNDEGIIVLHDMIPITRDLEKSPRRTGDGWRAFADFRKLKGYKMHVLVPPWGTEDCLGFISKIPESESDVFEKDIVYDYDFLLENVEDLMNTIDLNTFYNLYITEKLK